MKIPNRRHQTPIAPLKGFAVTRRSGSAVTWFSTSPLKRKAVPDEMSVLSGTTHLSSRIRQWTARPKDCPAATCRRERPKDSGRKEVESRIFHYLCGPKIMRRLRTYMAFALLLLFSCYYCGISMMQHTHIANGSSIVHSHLGGDSKHDHSDSQYAVIDMLSCFDSEQAETAHVEFTPALFFSESCIGYHAPEYLIQVQDVHTLRGPPTVS